MESSQVNKLGQFYIAWLKTEVGKTFMFRYHWEIPQKT